MHSLLCTKDDAEGEITPDLRHIDRPASAAARGAEAIPPFLSIPGPPN
jgi:hypothetical protein